MIDSSGSEGDECIASNRYALLRLDQCDNTHTHVDSVLSLYAVMRSGRVRRRLVPDRGRSLCGTQWRALKENILVLYRKWWSRMGSSMLGQGQLPPNLGLDP